MDSLLAGEGATLATRLLERVLAHARDRGIDLASPLVTVNLEGMSRPSGERGSTTSGYNSS